MKINAKVFKRKSGKSEGKWTARITFVDPSTGERKTIERLFSKRVAAMDERDKLVNDLKKSHGQSRKGERMTFADLAKICDERFYLPAVIVEGRKVSGVRSYKTAQNYLRVLIDFFGRRLVGNITSESLVEYRNWRLRTGSRRPEVRKTNRFVPVKLATINRELSAMRRMMRYALAQGWISRDIFFGASVIDASAEMERTRILTHAEEASLLDACQGARMLTYRRERYGKSEIVTATANADSPHLRAIILLAVDSGMRRGEILKLRWEHIDFKKNRIRILGTHTKTERERWVPLTDRVKTELYKVKKCTSGSMPFPFADFKRSWTTAKRIAGIEDLHFHDLRRTALTRWQQLGLPLGLAGKIAGHTNLQTTMKHYTSADSEIIQTFTEKMNLSHSILDQNGPRTHDAVSESRFLN